MTRSRDRLALTQPLHQAHVICSWCGLRATWTVTRHDGTGRTTTCGHHLERTMERLNGPSPIARGARVQVYGRPRVGVIRDVSGPADERVALIRWASGDETMERLVTLALAGGM